MNPHSSTASPVASLSRSHRWKVLAMGVAANASLCAVIGGVSATGVLLRNAYQFDTATLGWVLGMLGLGLAISELPWGLLTDRWGDRPVLLTGLSLTASALVAMALFAAPGGAFARTVPPAWLLALALSVVGLVGGSVNSSSGRAVMSWFGKHERGLAMSIRQTAVPFGYGFGALVMPVVAAHLGFVDVYLTGALLCCVAAVLAWRWLREPPPDDGLAVSPNRSTGAGTAVVKARNPMTDPQIWRVVSALGILCAPQFAVVTFGAVFLHDRCGVSSALAGGILATVQVGAMVVRVWSGRWTDMHGNRRSYLQACCLLSACAFAALTGLSAISAAPMSVLTVMTIAVLIASGISVSAWHGVAYAELAEMAGVQRAGTALALGNTMAFTLLFIAPSTIPYLLKLHTWSAVWVASVVCAIVARGLFPRPKPVSSETRHACASQERAPRL